MAHCAVWNPVSPSGDGRYMGKGWVVEGTGIEERIVTLRSHSVPAGANLAWQLPVKISFGEIPADAGPAFAQAPRASTLTSAMTCRPQRTPPWIFSKSRTIGATTRRP